MRAKIILSCGVCNSRNYTTEKSRETQAERIEVKKFCKHCNAHTIHRETK